MADKIIRVRIDVTKIIKEWLFSGEKGVYLDATIFFNEVKDEYKNNGMIVQSVPKVIWEAEKQKPKNEKTQGPILGNISVFVAETDDQARKESSPDYVPGFDKPAAPPPIAGQGGYVAGAGKVENPAANVTAPAKNLPF